MTRNATVLVLGLVFFCTGCANYRDVTISMARAAVEDYNAMQADAENRMFLTNVLRAKDRLPRHFTTIGSGSVQQAAGLSVAPGVGLAFADSGVSRQFSLGGSLLTTPRVELSTLSTQGFLTGYITPVTNQTLAYFFNQGFERGLVLHLFVGSFSICSVDKGQARKCESFVNDPFEKESYNSFNNLVRDLVRSNVALTRRTEQQVLGPLMSREEAFKTFAAKLAEPGSKLELDEGCLKETSSESAAAASCWRLTAEKSAVSLEFDCAKGGTTVHLKQFCGSQEKAVASRAELIPATTRSDSDKSETTLEVTIRSPEALIYYLGQVARCKAGAGTSAATECIVAEYPRQAGGADYVIFDLGTPDCTEGAVGVGVQYAEKSWNLCGGGENSSLTTLTIAQLALGLQKDARELALTTPIVVSGR